MHGRPRGRAKSDEKPKWCRSHLDEKAKMVRRYRTSLGRYRRLMARDLKFDVTIEKREFDHNLILHAARCVAVALARSLC